MHLHTTHTHAGCLHYTGSVFHEWNPKQAGCLSVNLVLSSIKIVPRKLERLIPESVKSRMTKACLTSEAVLLATVIPCYLTRLAFATDISCSMRDRRSPRVACGLEAKQCHQVKTP